MVYFRPLTKAACKKTTPPLHGISRPLARHFGRIAWVPFRAHVQTFSPMIGNRRFAVQRTQTYVQLFERNLNEHRHREILQQSKGLWIHMP
jgi:hypothetical protein